MTLESPFQKGSQCEPTSNKFIDKSVDSSKLVTRPRITQSPLPRFLQHPEVVPLEVMAFLQMSDLTSERELSSTWTKEVSKNVLKV